MVGRYSEELGSTIFMSQYQDAERLAAGDAMKDSLRCMAEGRDDEWTAICIDLDIAVQGRSFHEVYERLESAIDMYLERVAELPENERPALLNRRSPWLVRAKFAVVFFLSHFGRRAGGTRRPFMLQAHRHAHA